MNCKRHELLRLAHSLEMTYAASGRVVGKGRVVQEKSERRQDLRERGGLNEEAADWVIELADAVASVTDLGADKVERGILYAHERGCVAGLATEQDRDGWLEIVVQDDTRMGPEV